MTKEWALFQTPMTRSRIERDKCTFLTDILSVHSFPVYGTVVLLVTTLPTMLYSIACFFLGGGVARGGGGSGVNNACISFPNKQDLPPAFYPSFILVIFTSRIYVTLNLPVNSSSSRNGLEHKKILLYCIDSSRLLVFTGWF